MSKFEDEIKEIEEEIMDANDSASIETRFNVFRREFKNHALSMRIFMIILFISSLIQTGLLIAILSWIIDIFAKIAS